MGGGKTRHRSRCLEDTEKDVRQMKFKKWRQAMDREDWESAVKEARLYEGYPESIRPF